MNSSTLIVGLFRVDLRVPQGAALPFDHQSLILFIVARDLGSISTIAESLNPSAVGRA